jgi:hypothetical protein
MGMGVSMSAALVLALVSEAVCGRPRDSIEDDDVVVVVVVLVDPEPAGSRLCACAGSEKKASPSGSIPPPTFGSSSDIKPNALLNSGVGKTGVGVRYVEGRYKKRRSFNHTLSFLPPLIICRTHGNVVSLLPMLHII